jgi:hypothetical protein
LVAHGLSFQPPKHRRCVPTVFGEGLSFYLNSQRHATTALKKPQKDFRKKFSIKMVLLQLVRKAVILEKDDSFEGVVYNCSA